MKELGGSKVGGGMQGIPLQILAQHLADAGLSKPTFSTNPLLKVYSKSTT